MIQSSCQGSVSPCHQADTSVWCQGQDCFDDLQICRLLELPQPEMDALDRVAWNVTPAEVSKTYRLSL